MAVAVGLLLCFFITFQSVTSLPLVICAPLTTCSCENTYGVIDISPLARDDGNPRYRDIPDPNGKDFYSWNPCYNFNETSCLDVAVAKLSDQRANCSSLGNQSTSQFVSDSETGLELVYTNWSGRNMSSHVILTCDLTENGTFNRRTDMDFYTHVYFELRSKYVCPVAVNQTTTRSTSTSTTFQTPAFIGTAMTIQTSTTEAPMFGQDILGGLMAGVLLLLLVLLIVISAFFFHISSRLPSGYSIN